MPVSSESIASLLRAYSAILFCSSPRFGAWLALMTLWSPGAALAGAVALIAAMVWARLLSLAPAGEPHLVNSLLAGLFIGAFHAFDSTLLVWLSVVSLSVTLLSSWLATRLWQAGRLPLLSLPFVLGCWLVALSTQNSRAAAPMAAVLTGNPAVVGWQAAWDGQWGWADGFFSALGWLLLVPYPLAGALIFVGLVVVSRYLALLAIAGYLAGQGTLLLFGRHEAMLLGFNFMLTSMALGGIFATPGRLAFFVAALGAVCSAGMAMALGSLLQGWHLPLLTLPFILAVWLWLGALGSRQVNAAPTLLLDAPSAPEISFESWRLAKVRGQGCGRFGSLPVTLPFYGEWQVTQGFNGRYTHRDAWQHALDFEIFDGASRHAGSGQAREDYFCFGAPLLAPINGQVVAVRDDLADVEPGQPDVANNWGNYVLLRAADGSHVLLAHLRQRSLLVSVGVWVLAGQALAACGSSGRAPVPHLHLHAQSGATLGGPTSPFHLVNVLLRRDDGTREFRLCYEPLEGDVIAAAPRDERFALAMSLPSGMCWRFRYENGITTEHLTLRSELTLLGQSRLIASNGASVAYESSGTALGCFGRCGPGDRLLDLWTLALGLTPFSTSAECWHDQPSAELLPVGLMRRLIMRTLYPLGAACRSSYRRCWDETANAWRQEGNHRLRLLPGLTWQATTRAWIAPNQGVVRLELTMFGRVFRADLESVAASAAA